MKGRVVTVDFTKSFIAELAGYISREYISVRRPMTRLAVVFGGKRPVLFLKRELARRHGQVLELPFFFAIDDLVDLVANQSGFLAPSSGELDDCYEIYRLVRELTPELLGGREDFARFLPWARELRRFIEQADLEDVSARKLLDVEESARIGFPVPESVNRLLSRVSVLREAFHASLLSRGNASRGMQYMRAAANARQNPHLPFDEIIFANFFHFHSTEEALVRSFYEQGQATFFFQGDRRKWSVLERLSLRLGCDITEGAEPVPVKNELKVHAAYDMHSQAAIARDILAGIDALERTVVVLPDTGALVPLISSLPQAVRQFNVSMGYPLNRGSVVVLLRFVFAAQASRRNGRYYSRDYLKLVRHPFIRNSDLFAAPGLMSVLVRRLEAALSGRFPTALSGTLFFSLAEVLDDKAIFDGLAPELSQAETEVSADLLRQGLERIHHLCFEAWEQVNTLSAFADAVGHFLDVLTQGASWGHYPLNVNIAERLYSLKDELAKASFASQVMSMDDLVRIFMSRVDSEVVSFTGAPLKGLQILGLFETRSLDFDNVIILDVNEGVLPGVEVRSSLIPREILSMLGLERIEEEEDIQRYQFMRIISSAKRVHLVYQDTKEKAPSRFVEELVWEEQKKRGDVIPFPTERAGFALRLSSVCRQARKTPLTMEFLRGFSFSATSINMYLENPFRFYRTFVLGLREPENMLDEPDALMVGNFWHRLLEELFRPLAGRPFAFSSDDAARGWHLFERFFDEYFSRRMRSDSFLVRAVAEHKFRSILEDTLERQADIAEVVSVEKSCEDWMDLSCGRFRFKSKIDRLDRMKDGRLLILDYKTGSADRIPPDDFVFTREMGREGIYRKAGSFQLPLYLYSGFRLYPGQLLDAGLYRLREVRLDTVFDGKTPLCPGTFLAPYLDAIDYLVSQIMDPDLPFEDHELARIPQG